MAIKRKVTGGLMAVIGFLLSPLSWWNDAFVNLPLALVFAWIISAPFGVHWQKAVFQTALVLGYWLTNLLGFILLHKGANRMITEENAPLRHSWKQELLVSAAYTALIVVLIKLGVLKPFEDYFGAGPDS